MTLEEKAALCTGASAWTTTAVERLGIPAMLLSDGPHGVRRVPDVHALAAPSLPATCFPTAAALAATWDPQLLYTMGEALAAEARALGVDVLLGPGVNIKRSPLGGRNFEYFSEDPYLAGVLASSLIQGIQSQGVGTSLKHYAVNNQEHERLRINAVVDERTLREIYLPAFERAVKEARPWTVMCAYNKVNGIYCSENARLLTQILKGEWGFDGVVVSDWGAVHDRVRALEAGLDLEMPGPKPHRTQAVVDAVRSGALDEAVLDEAVRRILAAVERAAATPKETETFDVDAHHALARRVAAAGMVLLKNDGILPLQKGQCLAVIGRAAREPHFQGGGSSHINPTRVDIPLDELARLAGEGDLTYREGYPADDSFQQELIDEAVAAAAEADVALIFAALPASKESEGYDRTDLDLTRQQVALIQAVSAVQPRTVVVLNSGSAIDMQAWIDGVAAVVQAWLMGQAGGGAIADVLYGVVNPSGRLAETFPMRLEDTPAFLHFPGENGEVRYGEGLYVGYRYYDARQIPVLFPFGHGLSYTTFEYSHARPSSPTFREVDGVDVLVEITNTGQRAGAEVVQVYVRPHQARLARPPKELKGFAKVELAPGETRTVTIHLDERAFAYFDPAYGRWVAEGGQYDLLIGASSADIRAQVTVTLEATRPLPSRLDMESTVQEWLADPIGRPLFEPMYQQMVAQLGAALGGEDTASIGMDMTAFILDMPLVSILGFQEAMLPAPAEEIVVDLLRRVQEANAGAG
uniref:Glycosyl hydrolase n=2 Tax=Litorilinea aerophila TaxID=1204385 RepID=A0A540VKI8_9CHLR